MTNIQPPDPEARIAILHKKAASQRLAAGTEVLGRITSHIIANIHELKGALARVTALVSPNQQEIILELTGRTLRSLMPEDSDTHVDTDSITTTTCVYFGISADELAGVSRIATLARARQTVMYLCQELIDLSLPKIGFHFGGRNHTTVMHSVKKTDTKMGEDRQFLDQVTKLTSRIKRS